MSKQGSVELVLVLFILVCLAIGYCAVLLAVGLWDSDNSKPSQPLPILPPVYWLVRSEPVATWPPSPTLCRLYNDKGISTSLAPQP